jgi:diadenosine tetraphosphate (Ap4A) HIT family hydrolase
MTECLSCLSVRGERRISPGPFIAEERLWVVDHAYPAALPGWLVIVPRRHVEALHELTAEECAELAELQRKTALVLRAELGCQKEYMACFAEGAGFAHVHIHMVPRPADLPAALRGPDVFRLVRVEDAERDALGYRILPPHEVIAVSERLQARWQALTGL